MNKIIKKFLLTGDKFMPDFHLKQSGFAYSACGPFTKHLQRIQKCRETGNLKYLYRHELDKVCFGHDAAYSDSKDLTKRTISDGYQRALASMVYKFFDKKTGSGISVNEQLAEKLHRLVTKAFKRRKVYARFKDNIC